jgi:hypothetical protein
MLRKISCAAAVGAMLWHGAALGAGPQPAPYAGGPVPNPVTAPSFNATGATPFQMNGVPVVGAVSPASGMFITQTLSDHDTSGPQTYTSSDGIGQNIIYGSQLSDIYKDSFGFRDPRIIKIGSVYYETYTRSTGSTNTSNYIGLASSVDLEHWTVITTPNWSSFFHGTEQTIANGGWFYDPASNTWYLTWGTFDWTAANSQAYYVTFNPTNNTFGTPQAFTFSPARSSYTIVMAMWLSGGTYYALLQSTGSGGGGTFVELASSSSISGTWNVIGQNNFAGWGAVIEGAAQVTMPDGSWRVYWVDLGGGNVHYSNLPLADIGSPTSGWSAPEIVQFPGYFGLYDWIDVRYYVDPTTYQNINNLAAGSPRSAIVGDGGAVGGPAPLNVTVTNASSSGFFTWADTELAPNLATGASVIRLLGQSATTGDSGFWNFTYQGANSASNAMSLGFYAGPTPLTVTNGKKVGINNTAPVAYFDEISGDNTGATLAFSVANSNPTREFGVYDNGSIVMPNITNSNTGDYMCWNAGTVQWDATACAPSLRKYKENITPISGALDEVMKLEPVAFKYKTDTGWKQQTQFGMIAEDVEKVDKRLAGYKGNGELNGVDYPKGIPVLAIAAIQEQQREIEGLKQELAIVLLALGLCGVGILWRRPRA